MDPNKFLLRWRLGVVFFSPCIGFCEWWKHPLTLLRVIQWKISRTISAILILFSFFTTNKCSHVPCCNEKRTTMNASQPLPLCIPHFIVYKRFQIKTSLPLISDARLRGEGAGGGSGVVWQRTTRGLTYLRCHLLSLYNFPGPWPEDRGWCNKCLATSQDMCGGNYTINWPWPLTVRIFISVQTNLTDVNILFN